METPVLAPARVARPQAPAFDSSTRAAPGLHLINPQRVRIPSDWLEPGLHVVELDRPWHDTPFVVEGFLVDRTEELQTLRQSCRSVHVDLDRSLPFAAHTIRARLIADSMQTAPRSETTAQTTESPRRDARLSHAARLRFRQLMQMGAGGPVTLDTGWLDRLLGWLLSRSSSPGTSVDQARQRLGAHARRGLLPPEIEPTSHPDTGDFPSLIQNAGQVIREADRALASMLDGRSPQHEPAIDLQALSDVAYHMADAMIAHPDTLLWCANLDDGPSGSASPRASGARSQALKTAIALLMLGRHLGLGRRPLAELALTGLLADLGKARLNSPVLHKPGMLTEDEFRHVQSHVGHTTALLAHCPDLPVAVEIGIAQHHERLDGSGYPAGLSGDAISLYGRMAAIADTFSALISPRAHAPANSAQDAFTRLCEWAGSSFDEPLVEQFIQALTAWPSGTLAELDSGEVAMVMVPARQPGERTLVQVLLGPDKQALDRPQLRRMGAGPGETEHGPGRCLLTGLPAGAYGIRMSAWAERHGLAGVMTALTH